MNSQKTSIIFCETHTAHLPYESFKFLFNSKKFDTLLLEADINFITSSTNLAPLSQKSCYEPIPFYQYDINPYSYNNIEHFFFSATSKYVVDLMNCHYSKFVQLIDEYGMKVIQIDNDVFHKKANSRLFSLDEQNKFNKIREDTMEEAIIKAHNDSDEGIMGMMGMYHCKNIKDRMKKFDEIVFIYTIPSIKEMQELIQKIDKIGEYNTKHCSIEGTSCESFTPWGELLLLELSVSFANIFQLLPLIESYKSNQIPYNFILNMGLGFWQHIDASLPECNFSNPIEFGSDCVRAHIDNADKLMSIISQPITDLNNDNNLENPLLCEFNKDTLCAEQLELFFNNSCQA